MPRPSPSSVPLVSVASPSSVSLGQGLAPAVPLAPPVAPPVEFPPPVEVGSLVFVLFVAPVVLVGLADELVGNTIVKGFGGPPPPDEEVVGEADPDAFVELVFVGSGSEDVVMLPPPLPPPPAPALAPTHASSSIGSDSVGAADE